MPRYDFSAPRLFVTADLGEGRQVALEAAQAHYLLNVLRLKEGAEILLFNGRDGEWRAQITAAKKKQCLLAVQNQVRAQTAPGDIHYVFSPLKRARQDYLVQKATEMGASLLQPVRTARTVADRVKLERMQANVIEAAEQCGILTVPAVEALVALDVYLDRRDAARHLILCDEDAPVGDPVAALRGVPRGPLALLIGPEGGFSEEERARLHRVEGVTAISLGPRILRADTAGVAALTLVQAVLGDLAHP